MPDRVVKTLIDDEEHTSHVPGFILILISGPNSHKVLYSTIPELY